MGGGAMVGRDAGWEGILRTSDKALSLLEAPDVSEATERFASAVTRPAHGASRGSPGGT